MFADTEQRMVEKAGVEQACPGWRVICMNLERPRRGTRVAEKYARRLFLNLYQAVWRISASDELAMRCTGDTLAEEASVP